MLRAGAGAGHRARWAPHLFQGFSDNSFSFSLVVRLHAVLEVVENLGVLVMTHALTHAVTGGLGAPMQHPW